MKNTNLKKMIDIKRMKVAFVCAVALLAVTLLSIVNPESTWGGFLTFALAVVAVVVLSILFPAPKNAGVTMASILPFNLRKLAPESGEGGGAETEAQKKEREFMQKVATEVKSLLNTVLKDAKFEDNEAFKALKALAEGSINKTTFEKLEKECEKLGLEVKSLKEKAGSQPEQNWLDGLKDNLTGLREKMVGKSLNDDLFTIKAAAAMTEGASITSTTTGSAYIPMPTLVPGVVAIPRNRPVFMENFDVSTIGTPKVVWINETDPEGDAEFIAEGSAKPLADFTLTSEDMNCKKVAVRFNVSNEMLDDIPYMMSEIQNKGLLRTKLVIDGKLLAGTGAGNEIKGIKQYAPAYTLTGLNGTVVNPNFYDVIGAAIQQIINASDEWYPNVIFMNPQDKFIMEHTKTTTEEYAIMQLQLTQGSLYGCKVITTNQIPKGDFLVGDFTKAHVRIYKDLSVRVGLNGDDFKNNMVTILIEARLLQYVSNNEKTAFVYDQYADVQTALEALANP